MNQLRSLPLRALQRGLTLIEMMVALLIGMLLTLAIFAVLGNAETLKRTTTSMNDINQTGNYAMYAIDKWVRSAGSGFAESAPYSFGCNVHSAKSGAQVLPRTAALPAPFGGIDTGTANVFRLAPVLIAPGQMSHTSGANSDALIVMAGAAGNGEIAVPFDGFAATGSLSLLNTVSLQSGDVMLVADEQTTTAGLAPCMIQQVSSAASAVTGTTVALGGTYQQSPIASADLTAFTTSGKALKLGNIAAGNPPMFQVIGVGDNNTLVSYDLLQSTTTPMLTIADGVFELHAVYGVDTSTPPDGTIDAWVDPMTSATYTLAALMAGTPAASDLLQTIKAVRVGLITRTSLPEVNCFAGGAKANCVVAPATLTLFADLGLTRTRTLNAAERVFRYRTIESTIPLRNAP